jgi:hypothetical protein
MGDSNGHSSSSPARIVKQRPSPADRERKIKYRNACADGPLFERSRHKVVNPELANMS